MLLTIINIWKTSRNGQLRNLSDTEMKARVHFMTFILGEVISRHLFILYLFVKFGFM